MPEPDKIGQLYDALKADGAIEHQSESDFRSYMGSEANSRALYGALKSDGAIESSSYEEFRDRLGLHEVKPQQPVARPVQTQVQTQLQPVATVGHDGEGGAIESHVNGRSVGEAQPAPAMASSVPVSGVDVKTVVPDKDGSVNTVGNDNVAPGRGWDVNGKHFTSLDDSLRYIVEQDAIPGRGWKIGDKEFGSAEDADRYVKSHPEMRFRFMSRDGVRFDNVSDLVRHRRERDASEMVERRISSALTAYDPDNVAESVWDDAERRSAQDFGDYLSSRREVSIGNVLHDLASAGDVSGGLGADNYEVGIQAFASHLKYHDLRRMADEAWERLGKEKRDAVVGDIYGALRERYPDADSSALMSNASAIAKEQSDKRMFELAVEKHAPQSATDYFFRKAFTSNALHSLMVGLGRYQSGSIGDMEARDVADQRYGDDHKLANIAGIVTGMAIDPLTWIAGGVGGAASKGAMWLGGKLAGDAVMRKFGSSLAGRMLGGVVGGAAYLGVFEAGGELLEQQKWGGSVGVSPETGHYEVGDYDLGAVGGRFVHGMAMGAGTGMVAPLIGNVSDKLVRATESTVGKLGIRAGELGVSTVAEGTIFSIPEWIEGNRDAMDVWTENMAMMAGFKTQHLLKSVPRVIGELAASKNGKAGFETRLRSILDGRGDLALTEDEKKELERRGYGDLKDLTEEYSRYVEAKEEYDKARPTSTDAMRMIEGGDGQAELPYNRFVELMTDNSVSEAARAKMYYYLTGHGLPMSTVMGSSILEDKDADGNVTGYTVQSFGANGVITSSSFGDKKRADVEVNRINRQAELNGFDVGERYYDWQGDNKRMYEACETVAEETGAPANLLFDLMKRKTEAMNEVELEWAEKILNAYNGLGDKYGSSEVRIAINEEFGIDVDKAIRKEPGRRSEQERKAASEYANRLFADVKRKQEEASQSSEPHDPNAPTTNNQIAALLGIDDSEQGDPVSAAFNRGHEADAQERQDIAIEVALATQHTGLGAGDAQEAWNGVVQRINEDAAYMVAQQREQTKQMQHTDGSLRPAILKEKDSEGNDQQVYIVDGNVQMMPDGITVDKEASDNIVVVYNPATGERKQIDPSADTGISSLGEVTTAEQREAEIERRRQEYVQTQIDEAQGTVRLVPGQQLVLPTGEEAVVVATDADGENITVRLGDGTQATVQRSELQRIRDDKAMADYRQRHGIGEAAMPSQHTEQPQAGTSGVVAGAPADYTADMELTIRDEDGSEKPAMVMGRVRYENGSFVPDANGNIIEYFMDGEVKHDHEDKLVDKVVSHVAPQQPEAAPVQEASAETPATVETTLPPVEQQAEVAPQPVQEPVQTVEPQPTQPAEAPAQPTEQPTAEPMPVGEDGEEDWQATTPERAHAYIFNEAGLSRSEGNEFIAAQTQAAQSALVKAKSAQMPRVGTSIKKYNEAKAKRQEKIDEAQRVLDYWQQVRNIQNDIQRVENERRAAEDAVRHDEAVAEAQAEYEARKQAEAERKAVGNENPMPSITEKWNNATKVDGHRDEIMLPDGTPLKGHYVLHESGASSPSHNTETWQKTDGFPMDANDNSVNDRDYERDHDAQEHTQSIARQYDQRALQSVPVVSNDGVVLSGNGRTMAGELAARDNTDGAYVNYLKEYAPKFGFTPEQVEAMQHPRVSFVPDEAMPYTAETFAKFNQQEMKSQNKTEQAVKLGKTVNDDSFKGIVRTINGYDTLGDFYNDAEASLGAVYDLHNAGVVPQAQLAEMVDGVRGQEKLSAVGREFLENMLIGKAFEGDPEVVRMLTAEPAMRQTVITALGEIVDNIALGGDWSLQGELADAVKLCFDARQGGAKYGEIVSTYARQGVLFADPDELQTVADFNNATMLMLADVLNDKRVTLLKTTLQLYNNNARQSAVGQADLFVGGIQSREDILRDVITFINENYGKRKEIEAARAEAVERRKAESVQQDGTPPAVSTDGEATSEPSAEPAPVEAEPVEATEPVEAEPNAVQTALAAAEQETNTEPTEAQKEAGNYKKGHVKIDGYDVTIENPKGSVRRGTDASGKQWEQEMQNTYGYIRGTEGVDGDHIDVFFSEDPSQGDVFVVDQVNKDGSFDEHKVMYGFPDIESARKAYLSNYEDGWQGLGAITHVSKEEFKKWIDSSHRKTKPFAEYSSVKPLGDTQLGEQPNKPTVKAGEDYVSAAERIARENEVKRTAAHFAEETQEEATAFDKRVPEMDDAELLEYMQEDGRGDLNKAYHPSVYDEYDYRHGDEQLQSYDDTLVRLNESGTTLEQAEEMLANIQKDVSRLATEDRAMLLGQEDALQEYIAGLEKEGGRDVAIPSQQTEQNESDTTSSTINGNGRLPEPRRKNAQGSGKKSSSDGKIDDVGEVLAGARKDMRKEIAKSLANVTEAALVEKPFGKVYKKPDLKKAVESGALREKDAIFYEALFSMVNQQKPKVTQSEMRSKRYIPDHKTKAERWAADAFKQMEVLRQFVELDEPGRDAMMQRMLADRYPTREQELAEILKRKGWNPDYEGHKYEWGEMTTPNPLWVTHEVMNRLGYSVGDKLDVPYGVVKANTSGTGYSIENLKGERASLFGSGMTLDEAIDRIVYLAKLKRGDADVSHPTQLFAFPATKSESGESGRYRVMWGRDYKTREFDSKDEADAFAQTKSGAYVSPIMETKRRFGYKVRFIHPLTGEKMFVDDAEFDTKEEAQAYFDGNFEKLNEATNAKLQEEREKKGEKKTLTADDVVHVAMVHSGKGGWTHAVVIDKKYANNDGQVRIIKEGFASRKDAKSFADSVKDDVLKTVLKHKEDAKKIVYFDTGENSRIGEDYRNGKNVDAEDFMNTFGFRGVQFGNWTNQADRQMAVNQAYDAFMDMSRLIGVSPKAMSLNGELGIAFGARGVGGFAAHYEPGEVVINLTKTQGAGSLAHEWWHALDNYFARRSGSAGDMVTDNRRIEMRDALRKAFNDMLDLVNGSDYAQRSAAKGEYWGRTHEITARLLAEWVDRELKKRGELNTFLSRGAVVERGQQHNYDMYEVLERLAGREPMSFEDFRELPESLKGIPYPSAKEVEQFGGSLRHIFDTLEEKFEEETGNVMLYEPTATYETRDGKKVVWRSLFDEMGVRSSDEVAMVSQDAQQGQGQNQVIAPSEIRLRKLKKGETCHVERVYEETKQFDFTGKEKVESVEDVAYIFRQLENAAVENSFLVLVKDGHPTVIHLAMGAYTSTMAPFEHALVAYRELKPEQVYFVHNHPSGVLKASRQDQELLKRVKMAFGEDVVQQGIIIDTTSGKYGEFDMFVDNYDLVQTSGVEAMPQSQGGEVPVKVYQFSRQVFAPDWNPESAFKIVSSQSVAEFVSSHRLGEHKKMSFLVVNNNGNVVANVFLPWTKLSDVKSGRDAGDLLAGYVHQCGGVRGVLYGNYDYEPNDRVVLASVGGRMRQLNAPLMDALHVEHSAYESGWSGVGEPKEAYGVDATPFHNIIDELFGNDNFDKSEHARERYDLAATPEWMKSVGISGERFTLSFKNIKTHLGKDADHNLTAKEWHELPSALKHPFLVTSYGNEDGKFRLYTTIKVGDKFAVVGVDVVRVNQGKGMPMLELNRIKTVFGRDRYVVENGERILAWDKNITPEQEALLRGHNYREYPTIQELSAANVGNNSDIAKESGENVVEDTAKVKRTMQEDRDMMRSAVLQMGEKLHTNINIIEDVNEITHPNAAVQERRRKSKGWYDTATGQVNIVLDNNKNIDDVKASVGHETIAHKGLRELVGEENYDEFLDETYQHLRDDLKKGVDAAAGRAFVDDATKNGKRAKSYEQHRRTAVDELFGRMAEKPFEEFSEGERTLWQKIKATVRRLLDKFLGSLKLPKWFELGDNELRYILWRSKEHLERGKEHPIDLARDIVKREELGLTDEARYNMDEVSEPSFAARRDRAVKEHGYVHAGLNSAEVKVVSIKEKSPFDTSKKTKALKEDVVAYANEHGIIGTMTEEETKGKGKVTISKASIEKMVDDSATGKSVNKDTHLAIIPQLREVIAESVMAETHPDYNKGRDGKRSPENGYNPDNLIHRCYGAISIDGQEYRVKLTLKENPSQTSRKAYTYEVTKIELLDSTDGERTGLSSSYQSNSNGSHTSKVNALVPVAVAKVIKNVEKSYDTGKNLLEQSKLADESTDLYRDPEETEDIWNDQSLGLQERITAAATRLANNHRDNKTLRNDAMRAIGGNLSDLRKAMSLQRTFDMTTVKRVADLARVLMNNGYLNGLTQQEVKRLLAAVKNSVGHNDIEGDVQKVMDIMVDNQLKHAEDTLHELEAIRGSKVDARGVEVQGQLDPAGSHTMKVFKKTRGWEKTDIEEAISEAQQRMGSSDVAVADEAALEYTGLQLALEYAENIKDSKVEERKLREEIKQAHDDASERDRATDSYRQYIASLQEAIRQNKIERAQSYFDLVGRLSDSLRESIANAKNLAEPGHYRNYFSEQSTKVAESGLMFRDGDFSPRDRAIARDTYERMVSNGGYQFQEAVQDSMLGLKRLYQSILGRGTRMEDVDGFENAYLAENRMSSVNAAEQHEYYVRYMKPLLKAISDIVGSNNGKRLELTDYMMAKHGLERNVVMAQRDFDAYQQQYPNGTKTLDDFRERDYAGLTALTGDDDVAMAELAAQQMVDTYEQDHDTSELWQLVNDATSATLAKIYSSGLLSKERYEQIQKMFEYYIPLQGWDETTSDEVYGYLTSKNGPLGGSPIKHAKGRSSKADDPIATIALMADDAIRQGNRNKMKQTFLNFVLNHQSDLVSVNDLWLQYNAVMDEWEPVFADIENTDTAADVERKVEAFEERMQQLAESDPDNYKRGRDAQNIPYKVVKDNLKEHQVLVRRNGRTYVLTINGNPRAAQALNGLTNPDVETGGVVGNLMQGAQWLNRNLSAFYTTRNPDFVASNFLRDMLYSNCMTWVKESPKYALRFHKNFGRVNPAHMRILLGKWENGTLDESNYIENLFKQFMLNGGETGYTNIKDIDGHKREIASELKRNGSNARKAWQWLGEQLDLLNGSAENCARFAAFVTSREEGRSIERSIYDAKEISVNFNKKGSGGKMVNSTGQTLLGKVGSYVGGGGRLLYVFWNAGVQGTTNFARAAKRNPIKATAGIASMFMLGAVIHLLAQAMGGGDDDDKNAYYNLPEYVRRSNIIINAGNQWIAIPLPIEFRAFYGLGELAAGVITGNERYSDSELAFQMGSQISQILPLDMLEGGGGINPFVPSIAKPFVEAYIMNKSWTGLPVYKDSPWNKNNPEWTKAYKSANTYLVSGAKWLNEISGGDDYKKGYIDINPAKVEYLLSGIFGGAFTTCDKLVKMGETIFSDREFDWRNMLIANRVVKTGDERTANRKLSNEYFKYKDEYEETKRLLKKYSDEAATNERYKHRLERLQQSEEYLLYDVFDNYQPILKNLNDAKDSADEATLKSIENEENTLRRDMVDLMHAIEDDEKPDINAHVDAMLKREFEAGGRTQKPAGIRIAKRLGGTDSYGSPQNEYGQVYLQMRDYVDLAEDVTLQVALKNAKDSGDTDRAKDIESARRQITEVKKDLTEVPYTLSDGTEITAKDIMQELRDLRKNLLSELGITTNAATQ